MNKNKKIKVYHVQKGMSNYSNWVPNRLIVDRMEDANIVFFEGGEDISPSLYGEKSHQTTYASSQRDAYELGEFKKAQKLGLPKIGICRGAQFLCAMAGGKLVQHQENSRWIHPIYTDNGKEYAMTSTHHQAQYPWNMDKNDYKVIAWGKNESDFHLGYGDKELINGVVDGEKEVEICYYPKIKAICYQGHPEMVFDHLDSGDPLDIMIQYCRKLLDNLMLDKL